MAAAEIVDMRQVFQSAGKQTALSQQLLDAIEETHARGEQSIVLLNRRGYSSFVLCRSCGERMQCPQCDVTLTYHQRERSLICHYCDHRQRPPTECPACKGKYIYFVGEGTEQIEEMIQSRFPTLRIARLDRDTTARRHTYEQAILSFGAGELDMLVGTQMIAKGHDFPNVTLVGVVSVDAGLAMPDFRASERTFQLITQVAGRAGRGDARGRVVVQTFLPDHPTIRAAMRQDYVGFAHAELRHRKETGLPPFARMARIILRDQDQEKLHKLGDDLAARLIDALAAEREEVRMKGPMPCAIGRIAGYFRNQIVLLSRTPAPLQRVLAAVREKGGLARSDRVAVDVDPVSLL